MNNAMDLDLLDLLPAEWGSWVLENVIRGASVADIRRSLETAGFSVAAEALSHTTDVQARSVAAALINSYSSTRAMLRHALSIRRLKSPKILRIPPIPDSFIKSYYLLGEPVILNMDSGWINSMEHWTPNYLVEHFGAMPIEVQTDRDSDLEYELNLDDHRTVMSFADFMSIVLNSESSNDVYLCANNKVLDLHIKKLKCEIPTIPGILPPLPFGDDTVYLWVGPKGTVTPFHFDRINVLLVQIFGEKTITLVPPEATPWMNNYRGVHGKTDCTSIISASLQEGIPSVGVKISPGEAILIPKGWWHTVRSESVSISLSFTRFSVENSSLGSPIWPETAN